MSMTPCIRTRNIADGGPPTKYHTERGELMAVAAPDWATYYGHNPFQHEHFNNLKSLTDAEERMEACLHMAGYEVKENQQ